MKLDLKKLYVVYTPTKHSEKVDVFDGRPDSLAGLFRQVKGGLKIDMVHAIYTTKTEAQKESEKILPQRKSIIYTNGGARIMKGEGYAIFFSHVPAKDKYKTSQVTIFMTRKQAQNTLDDYVKKGVFRKGELKIMKY